MLEFNRAVRPADLRHERGAVPRLDIRPPRQVRHKHRKIICDDSVKLIVSPRFPDFLLVRHCLPAPRRGSPAKKFLDRFRHSARVLQFAFPDDKGCPAQLLQTFPIGFIANLIALQLCYPIFWTRTGYPAFGTAGMLMPEASVHQYDFTSARKNNVRLARQVAPVDPETISETVNEPPEDKLGFRILAANAAHVRAAAFRADLIHRGTTKFLGPGVRHT